MRGSKGMEEGEKSKGSKSHKITFKRFDEINPCHEVVEKLEKSPLF